MKTSYNKKSERAQEKINKIIFDHCLKESTIATALGITPQLINYQLHTAVNMDREIEKGIYIYFRSIGIVQYQDDECELINDHFLEFTSITTQQISILSNQIKKAVSDHDLNDDERLRLMNLTKNLRASSNK